MKNNKIVVIIVFLGGYTAIFGYNSSINFRLLLFSHLDTYFWLGGGATQING